MCTIGTPDLSLDLYVLPVGGSGAPDGDKYIIYRPLLKLAFVGIAPGDLPPAAGRYLGRIGFLEPDPPPPPPREPEYRPTNAVLLLTNRCYLRCVYWYARGGEGRVESLSPELARTAIDHVHRNAVDLGRDHFRVTFHGGGEPTRLWRTLEMATDYARAKDLPCRVSMVSNGVWTDRQRDWIIPNLNALTVSFDGGRETQDRQRPLASGSSSFEAVMRSLDKLDEAGFRYSIRMTALAPWRDRLAHDVEFLCRETGCRYIQVEPAFNVERGGYDSPTPEEAEDFCAGFMQAFEIAQRAGRRLVYSGARPWLLTHSFCSAPYGGLVVNPAGGLVTCYEITNAGHPLAGLCTVGHIQEGQIQVDAAARQAVLGRMDARRDVCRQCFNYWHCGGDCHVKTLYPGADAQPLASTRCQINRHLLAQMLLWYMAEAEDGVYRGRPPGQKKLP
ncbi:MAG: radical SAM protein [Anaerolineae bacterium]